MGRRSRRRSSHFDTDDVRAIFVSELTAIVAACGGLAIMAAYFILEPDRGNPANPISTLPHIFWEATAVRFFWPGVALFCLGAAGYTVIALRQAFGRE